MQKTTKKKMETQHRGLSSSIKDKMKREALNENTVNDITLQPY